MNGNVLTAIVSFTLLVLAAILMFAAMVARYKQRELQHRERMAALEKGLAPPEGHTQAAPSVPRTLRLRGLLWLFTGIAIAISFSGIALLSGYRAPVWTVRERIEEANRAKAAGATEAQIAQIMNAPLNDGPSPAIGLLGLIPIGVGLAYLVTWRSERRN